MNLRNLLETEAFLFGVYLENGEQFYDHRKHCEGCELCEPYYELSGRDNAIEELENAFEKTPTPGELLKASTGQLPLTPDLYLYLKLYDCTDDDISTYFFSNGKYKKKTCKLKLRAFKKVHFYDTDDDDNVVITYTKASDMEDMLNSFVQYKYQRFLEEYQPYLKHSA